MLLWLLSSMICNEKVTTTAFRVLVVKSAKTISIATMINAFVKICRGTI